MVTIVFGVAVAAAGGTAAGLGLGTYALIAAGGLLASYIDQTVIYPELFGKKAQRPDALEGFQVSTTDPGAPRWQVYGSRAWVPCHYMWSLNIRDEIAGDGQTGKGGRPFTQTVRADAGIGVADGPIAAIEEIAANEQPMWSRQSNRVVIEDTRWTVAAGTGAETGFLVLQATDLDVTDFSGILAGGDSREFVRLEGFAPSSINSSDPNVNYWRTVSVTPHASTAPGKLVLRPLRSQTPGAGTAGSILQPAAVRRIDQGVASHTWIVQGAGLAGGEFKIRRPVNDPYIPGLPAVTEPHLAKVWTPGAVYRLDGFTPSNQNGLYKLQSRAYHPIVSGGTQNPAQDYVLTFQRMEGQAATIATAGTAGNPGIITRDEATGSSGTQGRAFQYLDTAQEWTQYVGTEDQPQDPTLAASEPLAPAHRGIAHLSLKNWNWTPHGNAAPFGLVARVRARSGETVGQAISRICQRSMAAEHVDVSRLRAKALLGYAVPGGMPGGQALQPLQTFYGVVSQDRGGVLTFLDERDLPVVPVATRHLNARPTGEISDTFGFVPARVAPEDTAERVLLHYIDPAEGGNGTEGDGDRAPGGPTRGRRDTVPVNLRPLVCWPAEAKRRARELRRRVQIETIGGPLSLPPGYMDVLPGHCLFFRANNWHEEHATAATTISHTLGVRDLIARSVRVHVRFTNGQVATLQDNGSGVLEGLPAGITASTNTVSLSAGTVALTCSVNLDTAAPPRIECFYERTWLVRAARATLRARDFAVDCDVVRTIRDNPLPPVPRELTLGLGAAIAAEVPSYVVHVLDIPTIYPGQLRTVFAGIVACRPAGGAWRGATVWQSPNGTDHWTVVGQITAESAIGTMPTNTLLTLEEGASPGIVDWSTELVVDLPGGQDLNDATREEIALGINWLLVGDEIIAFHRADSSGGSEWTLSGLVRGLRCTDDRMTHADGERVVLLTNLGLHGLIYEPVGGFAAANRTYHLRVVPGGASIDQAPTISTLITGRSMRPAAPQVHQSLNRVRTGSAVEFGWKRRSIDQTTVFGPSPTQAGEFERYDVVAFDYVAALDLVALEETWDAAIAQTTRCTWRIGDESMGTMMVHRLVRYYASGADGYLAAGFVPGETPIGFVVYQVGLVGRGPRSEIVTVMPA
jgi:hypothetical protein